MALFSTLIDGFTDPAASAATFDQSYGTVTYAGSRAQVSALANGSFSGLVSEGTFSLLSSSLFGQVFPAAPNGAAEPVETIFQVGTSVGDYAGFRIDTVAGVITPFTGTSVAPDVLGTGRAYSPVSHRWLRLREADGTLFFETSPSGVYGSWSAIYSVATPSWITSLQVLSFSFSARRTDGLTNVAELDSLNIAATATQVPTVPTGLAAAPRSTSVGLTWTPSVGAVSYTVQRSTTSATAGFTTRGTVTTESYTDTTAPATTYWYRVTATNALGTSAPSTVLRTSTFADVVVSPVRPKIATLQDDFNALDQTKWLYFGARVIESRGRIQLGDATTGAFNQLLSQDTYDATGSTVYERIIPAEGPGSPVSAFRLLSQTTGTDFSIQFSNGQMTFGLRANGAFVAPQSMSFPTGAYVRIAESGGVIAVAISADGTTWIPRGTAVATPSWFSSVRISNQASGLTPSSAEMVIDSVNIQDVASDPVAPTPPVLDTVVGGNASATLTWLPPDFNGGSTVVKYRLSATPVAGGVGVRSLIAPPTKTYVAEDTTGGFTPGFLHGFRGAPLGAGFTPGFTPSFGSAETSTSDWVGSWSGEWATSAADYTMSALLGPLLNDVAYSVTITAISDAGLESDPSNAITVTPVAAAGPQQYPSPVTALSGSARDGGAAVTWSAPALGSGTFVGYEITASGNGIFKSYTSAFAITETQLAQLDNDQPWVITVAVRTTIGLSNPASVTITPSASAAALIAPLYPVDTITVEEPEPQVSEAPKIKFNLYAFPPAMTFTPLNFGLMADDPAVVG